MISFLSPPPISLDKLLVNTGGNWGGREGVFELTRCILKFVAVRKPRETCEKAVKS